MNGAESLVKTMVDSGVEVCFANPGTSEMHFVAALDGAEGMRCVLCLFEGVAAAAADGYARMTGRPAATLLHLGPGLANAGANLHNAMRAGVPVLNVVGDHATDHRHLDAPLASDIEGLARTWSGWVRTSRTAASVAFDAAEAIDAARSGMISTLILPADTAWNAAIDSACARGPQAPVRPTEAQIAAVAEVLRAGRPTVILLGNGALASRAAVEEADRIAQATGAVVLARNSAARMEAGAGQVPVEALPYPVDDAVARLSGTVHCILVGVEEPVAFFAYPDKPHRLLPDDALRHQLCAPGQDAAEALSRLGRAVGAHTLEPRREAPRAARSPEQGPLTPAGIGAALANHLPEGAIICDEALTSGGPIFEALAGAAPHSRLKLTGGAIGIGLPLSVGAAVACPERKVVVLQADGSGMYTLQALWTQAREGLDVVSVILSNRAYAILKGELRNVGVETPGEKAIGMMSLRDPDLDWCALANGMGVEAARAGTVAEFDALLARAMEQRGPFLIEADLTCD
ncbi:acetolactate synthase large subunit [uncultured Roseovarius sp.]|uniref:acetolactate synthase large subunit n=1 Tax=uncultured Roseovarius sp. TaxID=293344 RepID=UPI002597871A|nr:acetolactate synthase large subunit [uncultured Roseovarius sp.]